MADFSDYVERLIRTGNYDYAFDALYEIFTDEDLYRDERAIVYVVINYMIQDGFACAHMAQRLDELFEECAELGVVSPKFKGAVHGHLSGWH